MIRNYNLSLVFILLSALTTTSLHILATNLQSVQQRRVLSCHSLNLDVQCFPNSTSQCHPHPKFSYQQKPSRGQYLAFPHPPLAAVTRTMMPITATTAAIYQLTSYLQKDKMKNKKWAAMQPGLRCATAELRPE